MFGELHEKLNDLTTLHPHCIIAHVEKRSLWKSSTGQVVAFLFCPKRFLFLATWEGGIMSSCFLDPNENWKCEMLRKKDHPLNANILGSKLQGTRCPRKLWWQCAYRHPRIFAAELIWSGNAGRFHHAIFEFLVKFSGEDPVLCSCYVTACVLCSRPRTGERTPPEKLSGKMAWGDDSGFVLELVT